MFAIVSCPQWEADVLDRRDTPRGTVSTRRRLDFLHPTPWFDPIGSSRIPIRVRANFAFVSEAALKAGSPLTAPVERDTPGLASPMRRRGDNLATKRMRQERPPNLRRRCLRQNGVAGGPGGGRLQTGAWSLFGAMAGTASSGAWWQLWVQIRPTATNDQNGEHRASAASTAPEPVAATRPALPAVSSWYEMPATALVTARKSNGMSCADPADVVVVHLEPCRRRVGCGDERVRRGRGGDHHRRRRVERRGVRDCHLVQVLLCTTVNPEPASLFPDASTLPVICAGGGDGWCADLARNRPVRTPKHRPRACERLEDRVLLLECRAHISLTSIFATNVPDESGLSLPSRTS